MKNAFHSNGKLLFTAEFLVIDGAKALALPCKYGQTMTVTPIETPEIRWKSYTCDDQLWFENTFTLEKKSFVADDHPGALAITRRLQQVLEALYRLNSTLLTDRGFSIETKVEFPLEWGLGTSSTLLANLAQWAGVNPYVLSEMTFGGSAYDIACAAHDQPLLYQRAKRFAPKVTPIQFNPPFKEQLFFVYRNQKQNTRSVVAHYKKVNPSAKKRWIAEVSRLTDQFTSCQNLNSFEKLINTHENLIGKALQLPPVKDSLFPDYPGAIKSLGAWGGDFMLATGGASEKAYFKTKGYSTVLDFEDMVL